MPDIRHRVGIAAPQDAVYEAVATRHGLAGWWTRDVDISPDESGSFRFFFGEPEPGAVMQVLDQTPPTHVGWECVRGPDDWLGTRIDFDVSAGPGAETVLRFTQSGWREPDDFLHHCSTKWALFLLGLKASLEGGKATPFPDDMPISSWG